MSSPIFPTHMLTFPSANSAQGDRLWANSSQENQVMVVEQQIWTEVVLVQRICLEAATFMDLDPTHIG